MAARSCAWVSSPWVASCAAIRASSAGASALAPGAACQPAGARPRSARSSLPPVQAAGVDRPPLAVPGRLDLVQPEDVHVELRVAVAAGVLRGDGDRDLTGVPEPSGLHAPDPPAGAPRAHAGGPAPHAPGVPPAPLL